ncbi:type II toxin-antitoxin system mRNA interferase toxin, RelE/StbE family [Patescibacteria group bacterium]|nr:type II toxin-antitoxin system mRNA interferase toxin, RelE/StbE family [Patescibacteria group bacterium]
MKIKKINYTPHFERAFKSLPHRQKGLINRRIEVFRHNCFNPQLRTHKLKGKLRNLFSFSITPKYRIVFEFVDGNEVVFHDVGDHRVYQ